MKTQSESELSLLSNCSKNVEHVKLLSRSYSMLSVDSTRSSLTFDSADFSQRSPSIKDSPIHLDEATEQNTDKDTVLATSPNFHTDVIGGSSDVPVVVVEASLEQSSMEHKLGDGVIVEDLDDQKFGGFVSLSNAEPGAADQLQKDFSMSPAKDATDKLLTPKDESSSSRHNAETENHQKDSEGQSESSLTGDTKQIVHSLVHEVKDGAEQEQPNSPSVTRGKKNLKVDKLNEKKGKNKVKSGSKTGKRVSNKEAHKRSKTDIHDRGMDDNQSELSYQPDMDLSKSKASKKINGGLF